jgi:hypothetical protein
MMSKSKKSTRIIFSLPHEVHDLIKKEAFNRNVSMSFYILEAVLWRLKMAIDCEAPIVDKEPMERKRE